MTEFAGGAVDLSTIGGTLGPQQSAALMEELRHMAATREQALRDRVAVLAENDGFRELLALLTLEHGQVDDATGQVQLHVDAALVEVGRRRIAAVALEPDADGDGVVVSVLLRQKGEWQITNRKPNDDERRTLPVHEQSDPPIVTEPGAHTVIVNTPKGLRIAEWTPA